MCLCKKNYKLAIKTSKNPMVFMIVLYVKKAFKKVTSNRRILVYIQPISKITPKNKKHWVIKKQR